MRCPIIQASRLTGSSGWHYLLLGIWILGMESCVSSPYSAYNRGIRFYQEGLLDAAEIAFLESVQHDPKNDDSWNQLGMIAFEKNRMDDAEKRFRKAYELNRLHPAYPRNIALIYATRQNYEVANELIHQSLSLDPSDPETYLTQSKILWLQGQIEDAKTSISKALEIDPVHEESLRWRSRLQSSSN